jgi:DNA modification methylase
MDTYLNDPPPNSGDTLSSKSSTPNCNRDSGDLAKPDLIWEAIRSKAHFSGKQHALFHGDAAKCLALIPSDSIHTCLTSPPYWSARDYETDNQIGLENSVEDYVSRLVEVFREVRRVLRPDGTAWLNLGDCYINGAKQASPGWQRNKQLALIPFRVAIALEDDGWIVRNAVVWHKPNAMPASVRDRLTNTWEPVFLIAKRERYHFDLDAIRVPHKTDDEIERKRAENGTANGKAIGKDDLRRWLNSPRHRATIDGFKEVKRRPNAPRAVELAAYLRQAAERKGLSIKEIAAQLEQPFERVRHYMRTDEIGSRLPPEETWVALRALLDLDDTFDEAMAIEVGDNVFRNHPAGRNPGDMQSFPLTGGASDAKGHFAVMPDNLAHWCLRATLPKGGICLDPFFGVGTTGRTTLALGGRAVGIDVRDDFLRLAEAFLYPGRNGKKVNVRESQKV